MPEYDTGTTGSRKQKKVCRKICFFELNNRAFVVQDDGGFLGKLGGTLTRKKKQGSVPPSGAAPEDQQKAEEEEAEKVEKEGREAIDNHLVIRQPELKLLADGKLIFCNYLIFYICTFRSDYSNSYSRIA